MLSMRRFEKVDWYGWAGATPFSDGEPYISEFQLDDVGEDGLPVDAVLIAGAEGMDVYWWDRNGENGWFVRHSYDGRWSSEDARKVASRINQVSSLHDLFLLGFSTEPTEC